MNGISYRLSGMRIEAIHVYAVRGPRKEAVRSGTTATAPVSASEFGIVRLRVDDGREGLGEISITYPRIGFTLCHAARRLLVPLLMGRDPRRLPELRGVTLNEEVLAEWTTEE
jgi:L-alanine-DL-glutamate epimerase-like enolase superfamily enzyme